MKGELCSFSADFHMAVTKLNLFSPYKNQASGKSFIGNYLLRKPGCNECNGVDPPLSSYESEVVIVVDIIEHVNRITKPNLTLLQHKVPKEMC